MSNEEVITHLQRILERIEAHHLAIDRIIEKMIRVLETMERMDQTAQFRHHVAQRLTRN